MYTELLSWILPVLIIWAIVYYRLKKNQKAFKNAFRDGQPVLLQHDIEIETFVSKEAFSKASMQLNKRIFSGKGWKIFFGWVIFCCVVNFGSFVFMTDFRNFSLSSLNPMLLILPVLVLIAFPYLIKKQSANNYDNTEFIKHPVKYIFRSQGYEYNSSTTSGKASWDTIQGYSITDEFLLVYTGPIQALFLAKSSFTPEQLDTFSKFLEANFEFRKKVIA